MLIVGDVHGLFPQYVNLVKNSEKSIQVGDFGIGFPHTNMNPLNKLWKGSDYKNHKFIRGNHDNPSACSQLDAYIKDGYYDDSTGIFFCGGAKSIDRHLRVEGVSYWNNEELSYLEFNKIAEKYADLKPDIVITHDVAEKIAVQLFPFYNSNESSVTRQAFQVMLETHQPKIWIFGHWHYSIKRTIGNTTFHCLNELETYNLDL